MFEDYRHTIGKGIMVKILCIALLLGLIKLIDNDLYEVIINTKP